LGIISVIFLALALAMDAFAVALSTGGYLRSVSPRQAFRLSFHFGLFQFLMPLLGWFTGVQISHLISDYDHWIAWGLLTAIGAKMIYEAGHGDSLFKTDVTRGMTLVGLSIATSIDALAVGLSLAILNTDIFFPSLVIGIVAAAMTLLGLRIGERFSHRYGKFIERAGGIVLLLIGLKILVEHLMAAG
jgi:manganese efflux pump family protein